MSSVEQSEPRGPSWEMVAITVGMALSAVLGGWLTYRVVTGRMARETFEDPNSPAEWREALKQFGHQPRITWREGSWNIDETTAGASGSGVRFGPTPWLVEREGRLRDVVDTRALALMPLFASDEPRVVLTAMYAFREVMPGYKMGEPVRTRFFSTLRKLLAHDDVRVRWCALQKLGENGQLTADDVECALADEFAAIRLAAAFWLPCLIDEEFVYDAQGKLVKGDPAAAERAVQVKRQVIPGMVEHLNDQHFMVRHLLWSRTIDMIRRRQRAGDSFTQLAPPGLPDRIDWMRADWHTRETTRQALIAWWNEHGEAALRFAHPPQPGTAAPAAINDPD